MRDRFVLTGSRIFDGDAWHDGAALIVSFYAFVEAFARHRGLDPDTPPNLHKVTETR